MTGIKPEDWEREGWIAVCDQHLEDFKKEDELFGETYEDEDYICIMEGCNKDSDWEIYPISAEELKTKEERKLKNID